MTWGVDSCVYVCVPVLIVSPVKINANKSKSVYVFQRFNKALTLKSTQALKWFKILKFS